MAPARCWVSRCCRINRFNFIREISFRQVLGHLIDPGINYIIMYMCVQVHLGRILNIFYYRIFISTTFNIQLIFKVGSILKLAVGSGIIVILTMKVKRFITIF